LPLFDAKAPFDWKWWSEQAEIEIEISISLAQNASNDGGGQWTSLITGPVEKQTLTPLAGEGGGEHEGGHAGHEAKLVITGRDYAGQLIDSRMDEGFEGNPVSNQQIIGKIQQNHPELNISIQGAGDDGGDAVGDPYNQDQHRLFLNRSEWDVLTGIADHEALDITVQGKNITLAPPDAADAGSDFKVYYSPPRISQGTSGSFSPASANVESLTLTRDLQVSKGIDSKVQSFHAKTGKSHTSLSKYRGRHSNKPLAYHHNIPGMTKSQSGKHARNKADQLSKFEKEISFHLPGDPSLTPKFTVTLSGTGTAFDQPYHVNEITHSFDVRSGYTMHVTARDKDSQGSVGSAESS